MDTEKIISTILEKVGNTDVSQQTIQTLLDLNPLAEGTEPDDAYISKMVNAVKSIQGNVNHVFSEKLTTQVNQKVEEYKKNNPQKSDPKPNGSDPEWAKKLKEEWEAERTKWNEERAEWTKERTERAKKETLASVRQGLEDKFKEAGTSTNKFFLKSALSKLSIPEKDADIKNLVEQAEKLYNADLKEARLDLDSPHTGGGGGSQSKPDKEQFADIEKMMRRNRPQTNSN